MRVHAHFPSPRTFVKRVNWKNSLYVRRGKRETTRQKLKARTRFLCSSSDQQEEGKITSRATWPYKSMQILGNCFRTVVSRISSGISAEFLSKIRPISRISRVMKRYFYFLQKDYINRTFCQFCWLETTERRSFYARK